MIFFDIDATLMDHELAERNGALAFYYQYQKQIPYQDKAFLTVWKTLSRNYFQRFLANELSFAEQRRMRMKEVFGHDLLDTQADALFEQYVSHYQNNWTLFEDVLPALVLLTEQGHQLGIVSNGDDDQQRGKLQKLNILNYFSVLITSSKAGVAKPNPNIFRKACAMAQVDSKHCYYVGDQLFTDVIPSIKARMKGIWINRQQQIVPRYVKAINRLTDLETILKKEHSYGYYSLS